MENPVSYGFLAPPIVLIVLCPVGGLLALRWRRFGLAVVLAASFGLYLCAIPAVSSWLITHVEAQLPPDADWRAGQAIVVLGADMRPGGGTAPDILGPVSLERVFFAATAHRQLRVPVAVTGGPVYGSRGASASLMKAALEEGFAIPVAWTEDRSHTTWENAVFTARLLKPAGIERVVLVSDAWHLPRALWAFERAGLHALAWPAPRRIVLALRPDDFLPSASALHESFIALHEILGTVYYRLRY